MELDYAPEDKLGALRFQIPDEFLARFKALCRRLGRWLIRRGADEVDLINGLQGFTDSEELWTHLVPTQRQIERCRQRIAAKP